MFCYLCFPCLDSESDPERVRRTQITPQRPHIAGWLPSSSFLAYCDSKPSPEGLSTVCTSEDAFKRVGLLALQVAVER